MSSALQSGDCSGEFPPSLPANVLARSFRAPNGELGVTPNDVETFLAACELDHINVLGWELWLVDHICIPGCDKPQRQDGTLWALVPLWALIDAHHSTLFGGSSGMEQTKREIAQLDLRLEIKHQWLDHVRFNFTLSGSSLVVP